MPGTSLTDEHFLIVAYVRVSDGNGVSLCDDNRCEYTVSRIHDVGNESEFYKSCRG